MSGSGHPLLIAIINSFVHTIMYGYYFITSFKPELKQSIWWKKHITQVQLVRILYFITINFHNSIINFCRFNLPSCLYILPFQFLQIAVIQSLFYLCLCYKTFSCYHCFRIFIIKLILKRNLNKNKKIIKSLKKNGK